MIISEIYTYNIKYDQTAVSLQLLCIPIILQSQNFRCFVWEKTKVSSQLLIELIREAVVNEGCAKTTTLTYTKK